MLHGSQPAVPSPPSWAATAFQGSCPRGWLRDFALLLAVLHGSEIRAGIMDGQAVLLPQTLIWSGEQGPHGSKAGDAQQASPSTPLLGNPYTSLLPHFFCPTSPGGIGDQQPLHNNVNVGLFSQNCELLSSPNHDMP